MRLQITRWLVVVLAISFQVPVYAAPAGETPPHGSSAHDHTGVVDFDLDHGLAIHDASGELELKFGVLVQSRVDVRSGGGEAGFSLPVLRPALRARAGRLFKVFIQPELAGATPRLLDCAVDVGLVDDALSLRVGQWILPFSRAFLTPLGQLLFPDLPAADAAFRAGRDTGVMLAGRHDGARFTWDIGVFNGNGINGRNDDRDFEGVARVAWAPLGPIGYDEVQLLSHPADFRFALGAAAAIGEVTIATPADDDGDARVKNRWLSLAFDAVVQVDWFAAQVEYFQRQRLSGVDADTVDHGGYAQVGWTALRDRLMVGARVNVIDRAVGSDSGTFVSAEGVASVHLAGQHLKAQLRVGGEHAAGKQWVGTGTLQLQTLF